MTGISPRAIRPEPELWRGMARAALDTAYDNSGHVPESAAFLARWSALSALLRARRPELLDRRYGPRERNTMDIFRSGAKDAPLFVFIHGGYWQRNSKEVFSCMAEGLLASGVDVALPGYTLGPQARLADIVGEVHAAIRWLRREGPALGIAQGRLVASGWSAGAHLAATAMMMPEVDAGLCISGIFDLEPIRLCVLNEKLGLDEGDVGTLSPLRNLPVEAGPVVIAYGGCELPELQRQSNEYAAAWRAAGLEGTLRRIESCNHFSILEELATPGGRLARLAYALAAGAAGADSLGSKPGTGFREA